MVTVSMEEDSIVGDGGDRGGKMLPGAKKYFQPLAFNYHY